MWCVRCVWYWCSHSVLQLKHHLLSATKLNWRQSGPCRYSSTVGNRLNLLQELFARLQRKETLAGVRGEVRLATPGYPTGQAMTTALNALDALVGIGDGGSPIPVGCTTLATDSLLTLAGTTLAEATRCNSFSKSRGTTPGQQSRQHRAEQLAVHSAFGWADFRSPGARQLLKPTVGATLQVRLYRLCHSFLCGCVCVCVGACKTQCIYVCVCVCVCVCVLICAVPCSVRALGPHASRHLP